MHIFDHNHSKIIKVILNLPEFAAACKKLAQFIHYFIHSPCEWMAKPFLATPTPIFFYQLLISSINM